MSQPRCRVRVRAAEGSDPSPAGFFVRRGQTVPRPPWRVDPRVARDVNDNLVDGAADEAPGRVAGVISGHRLDCILADVEPLARERTCRAGSSALPPLMP